MKNKKWTRRQVVGSLAVLPLAANISLATGCNIFTVGSKIARCKLLNSNGEPYEVTKMDRFHICDLLSRPFPIDPKFTPGEISFLPVSVPFRISLAVEVPGFGEVFLYADNKGAGYTDAILDKIDSLFLNYEFAVDRLATIKKKIDECKKLGIQPSPDFMKRFNAAEQFFAKCDDAKGNDEEVAKWSMESLRESLYAGEMIVMEKAKYNIEQRGQRSGFLFGCNAFDFTDYGSPYTKLFESLFNFATLPFYMSRTQRAKGQFDYSGIDPILDALQNTQIIAKGHPLIFLTERTPDWVQKNKSFTDIKKICTDYIQHTIKKYRPRIHTWDVVNEAHVQLDTQYGDPFIPEYSKEKAIELSVAACKAAHEADPTCYRVINSTGTWADYYMTNNPEPWQQSAYDYLQMLEDAKCEYEAIGLQYYHSGRDMLEFERDVERFSKFKKPIHITELQIPSSSEEIPGQKWWGGGIGGAGLNWHGTEFTETIQADWVESIYTILFSKSYVDAITWWDMSDPGFVPHGGLVNKDLTPKESYYRLKALLDKWKSM